MAASFIGFIVATQVWITYTRDMPGVTTEGIILKRKDFGEADRVITILTPRYGKISVIARGVRRITSRRAGNVELLNRVRLHLFKAKSYTLTEAESIETFAKLKQNLTLATSAFHVIELIDRLTVEEQMNQSLYDLTVGVLQLLENNPRQLFLRAFEVKVLTLLGFWSINELYDVDEETKGLLEKLEYASWSQINELHIDEAQALALESIMRYYTEKVLEAPLKSAKVMRQIKETKNG